MLNILADDNIPGLEQLSTSANLIRMPGRQISREHLKSVDVLLIRSVTTVDSRLIESAVQLKFVGSATIGTDHVDQSLLRSENIAFASASGCNANAVVDYVLAALFSLFEPESLAEKRVGIVGCGNVGSRLLATLGNLGVSCRVYDPYVETAGYNATLEDVFASDVISLHVPLVRDGEHPTIAMVSNTRKPADNGSTLVNTSRGEIIAPQFFDDNFHRRPALVCDVWHGEPAVDPYHVAGSAIATTHIAGHSRAGKLRGSKMILHSLDSLLGLKLFSEGYPELDFENSADVLPFSATNLQALAEQLKFVKLEELSRQMKLLYSTARSRQSSALVFDSIRRTYSQRAEINYTELLKSG